MSGPTRQVPDIPYGAVTFAEQARLEASGQQTLIGIYPGDIQIEYDQDPEPPLLLLCCYIIYILPAAFGTFKSSILVRLINKSGTRTLSELRLPPPIPNGDTSPPNEEGWTIRPALAIRDLYIDQPCHVEVVAIVDNIEYLLGGLAIKIVPPENNESATTPKPPPA